MLKLKHLKLNSSILGVILFVTLIGSNSKNSLAKIPEDLQLNSTRISMVNSELEESPWVLGYSDKQIQIFYQNIVCDGKEMIKMRIINLTLKSLKIDYSLWEGIGFKTLQIDALANLEGICSEGYNYPLMELVPNQIKDKKVTMTVKYINL